MYGEIHACFGRRGHDLVQEFDQIRAEIVGLHFLVPGERLTKRLDGKRFFRAGQARQDRRGQRIPLRLAPGLESAIRFFANAIRIRVRHSSL
jgi:hypothetical protein